MKYPITDVTIIEIETVMLTHNRTETKSQSSTVTKRFNFSSQCRSAHSLVRRRSSYATTVFSICPLKLSVTVCQLEWMRVEEVLASGTSSTSVLSAASDWAGSLHCQSSKTASKTAYLVLLASTKAFAVIMDSPRSWATLFSLLSYFVSDSTRLMPKAMPPTPGHFSEPG